MYIWRDNINFDGLWKLFMQWLFTICKRLPKIYIIAHNVCHQMNKQSIVERQCVIWYVTFWWQNAYLHCIQSEDLINNYITFASNSCMVLSESSIFNYVWSSITLSTTCLFFNYLKFKRSFLMYCDNLNFD